MNPEENQESDQTNENWLSNFEDECLDELESEPNMDDRLSAEREYAVQNLWMVFQNSATAIAQLYKDRQQGNSMWLPFQNAAMSVTSLYKESLDMFTKCVDMGVQCGHQHRTRDIIAWARKKRRHIRREELLAYLCGRTPPTRHRLGSSSTRQLARSGIERSSQRLPNPAPVDVDQDLGAFREAIALQGLNGAMSNVSVGYCPHPPTPANLSRSNIEELNRFIHDEFSRYSESRKRTGSPDLRMDSPSRKKGRFL
ncbi:HUWE1-associated protein modifying stress responses [Patella vulgata]|uniref:Uncharacterized protein n=1 Tax=Patella caerulea TaxID=87958 RepID=A0AAN8PFK8_PATCE|nr:HUWE1-associated protein modifying stress responses [Patella vulgata]